MGSFDIVESRGIYYLNGCGVGGTCDQQVSMSESSATMGLQIRHVRVGVSFWMFGQSLGTLKIP